MSKFGDEYKRLNAKQREAVDTIEGPVLVIAGPGTGKTQLLSLRVANILTRTDAAPENILCLTFTNKAANNMRERLLDLVGSASLRVMVKTFHSFAVEIMNRYPDYFWNGARLVTVPGTVQLEIIQSVLDKLPLRSPLARKFAGEYTAIADVQTGLRLVKEAGLTPEKLRALITANEKFIDLIEPKLIQLLDKPLRRQQLGSLQAGLETLPKQPINRLIAPLVSLDSVLVDSFSYAVHRDQEIGKLTNLSQWKQRWLQTVDGKKSMLNERKRNSWWLELATVYAGYRDMLHRQGYYDYADMLVEVISQLEQNPDMLSEVQEQFLYVLIDEFQDTNAAQLRIAHLVADHHTSNSQPNLMVVGDDDQSIFKFNGAELNNMLNFRQFYKLKKPIILTQNYRSSQAILDTAKRVAEMAHDRLVTREPDLNKNLVAARPPRQTGLITHFRYPTRQHQLAAVAKEIERRFSPRNSVAVLARGHDSLRRLAVMLLESGIDVRYEQRNNVLEHEAVQHIHIMAKIVTAIQAGDEETVNTYLPQLLQHPMWRVKATTLWQLAVANHHQPHWLNSLVHHSNKQLQKLANWLLWLSGQSSEAPLPVIIEYLLGVRSVDWFTSPIKQYYLLDRKLSYNYLTTLSAIQILQALTDDFVARPSAQLADFVRFIDLSRAGKVLIADSSPFVTASSAVDLLTVHKAKGLEFDTAFIIDATEANWTPRGGGRKPPANLPLQPYGDDFDDYVRLMYVAMTRARHSVIITSYGEDELGNEVPATPLVREAIPQRLKSSTHKPNLQVLEHTGGWPELDHSRRLTLLRPILDNYRLSVSGLLNFLDVTQAGPDYFRRRDILRLPEMTTVNQAYGTAIHKALETAQHLRNAGHFSLKKVEQMYEQALSRQPISRDELARYLPHGLAVLLQLFKKYNYRLPKGSLPEQQLSDIVIGLARVGGTLDRIDITGEQSLTIVDYKTGKPLRSFVTRDQAKAVKAWRQRTQLIFYALLVQRSPRFGKRSKISTQIVYVEAESPNQLAHAYDPGPEEMERLEQLLQAVWQHIQTANFPAIDRYSTDIKGIQQFEDDLLAGTI